MPAAIPIAVDPLTPNTLYAGIIGNLGNSQQPPGLFQSVDGGENWIALNSPLDPGLFLASLTIDPQNRTLYVTGFYPNGMVSGSFRGRHGEKRGARHGGTAQRAKQGSVQTLML